MPTVLRRNGFRFNIYPGDHAPPHVHATKGGGAVIIELEPFAIRGHAGLPANEIRLAVRIAWECRSALLAAWERIKQEGTG